MDFILDVDWRALFIPDTSFLEVIVRGSVMYLALFIIMRLILKRQEGNVSISDVLVVVLIADAAQNAMSDDYSSIPNGILLVSTIALWSYTIDWLGYRFPRIRRLTTPSPLKLVEDGQIIWQNMRKELVTEEELMNSIRKEGLEDVDQVKRAFMESDGKISIIQRDSEASRK